MAARNKGTLLLPRSDQEFRSTASLQYHSTTLSKSRVAKAQQQHGAHIRKYVLRIVQLIAHSGQGWGVMWWQGGVGCQQSGCQPSSTRLVCYSNLWITAPASIPFYSFAPTPARHGYENEISVLLFYRRFSIYS